MEVIQDVIECNLKACPHL